MFFNNNLSCNHHHVVLVAGISLTLSRHFSLSFIASGRSSGEHPVSSHSCWMYVRAGRLAFARSCVGVNKSTSLMSSSLLLQQWPACLVRLTWIVFVIGGRWPYSWCLAGCCRQNLFKIVVSMPPLPRADSWRFNHVTKPVRDVKCTHCAWWNRDIWCFIWRALICLIDDFKASKMIVRRRLIREIILYEFRPVGWSCRICRLHLFREVRTPHPTRPPVGHWGQPVMLKDRALVVKQYMARQPGGQLTCSTPLWPLLDSTDSHVDPIQSAGRFKPF